jgi:hypothetical protein
MVSKAPIFEALKVLHNMYRMQTITINVVQNYLKEQYDLQLTVLANGSIQAESQDGKQKYKINQ